MRGRMLRERIGRTAGNYCVTCLRGSMLRGDVGIFAGN